MHGCLGKIDSCKCWIKFVNVTRSSQGVEYREQIRLFFVMLFWVGSKTVAQNYYRKIELGQKLEYMHYNVTIHGILFCHKWIVNMDMVSKRVFECAAWFLPALERISWQWPHLVREVSPWFLKMVLISAQNWCWIGANKRHVKLPLVMAPSTFLLLWHHVKVIEAVETRSTRTQEQVFRPVFESW